MITDPAGNVDEATLEEELKQTSRNYHQQNPPLRPEPKR